MRHIFIIRGAPTPSQENFVKQHGLSAWLVKGAASIPGKNTNHDAPLDRSLSILASKMDRGELIVFKPFYEPSRDNPVKLTAGRAVAKVIALAHLYKYTVHILDFSPSTKIQSSSKMLWHNALTLAESPLNLIEPKQLDLSSYANVLFVGDIHGCYLTLEKLTDNFTSRPDTAYVFLGDYINKGPESGKVLRALMDSLAMKPNCHFLAGNHETWLEKWTRGEKIQKQSFLKTGLPSFKKIGLTKQDASEFLEHTHDVLPIKWRGLDVYATHGGLNYLPESFAPYSSFHFRNGANPTSPNIDKEWSDNTLTGRAPDPKSAIQIHGHSNPDNRPIIAESGSYNLEGSIDSGQPLRSLLLHSEGDGRKISPILTKNRDISTK